MKGIKKVLLGFMGLIMIINPLVINAADSDINLTEAFPNEALREHIMMITQTYGETISKDKLLEIEDLDLRSNVQIQSFEELILLENLNDIMLRYQYELNDLKGIENFKDLTSLFIAYSNVSSLKGLEANTNLKSLWIVNLSHRILNEGSQVLEPLKNLNLQTVELNNMGLDDTKVSILKDMTSLKRVNVATFYENDSDIPESDWVTSLDSPLANKLTNLDFTENLNNLDSLNAADNQLQNINGLSNKKDTLKDVSLDAPRFGKPFSKSSSVTDLSMLYVSDNYNNEGITFAPMLTQYVNEDLKVDFINQKYYLILNDLKTFNIIEADGTISKGRVELDTDNETMELSEHNGVYKVSWDIKGFDAKRTTNGYERVFEIDMFDKDQRHATFIYSASVLDTFVKVRHIDSEGNDLLEPEEYVNVYQVGETYTINPKDIFHYTLSKVPVNARGLLNKTNIEIIFEYKRETAGSVHVHHVDVNNKVLDDDRDIDGSEMIGLEYNTYVRDIPNYTILEIPENAQGVFTKDEQHVVYVYEEVVADSNIVTPEKPSTQEKSESNNEGKTPQTGISTSQFFIQLIIMSLIILLITQKKTGKI